MIRRICGPPCPRTGRCRRRSSSHCRPCRQWVRNVNRHTRSASSRRSMRGRATPRPCGWPDRPPGEPVTGSGLKWFSPRPLSLGRGPFVRLRSFTYNRLGTLQWNAHARDVPGRCLTLALAVAVSAGACAAAVHQARKESRHVRRNADRPHDQRPPIPMRPWT